MSPFSEPRRTVRCALSNPLTPRCESSDVCLHARFSGMEGTDRGMNPLTP